MKIDDPAVLHQPYEFTYGYKKDPTYKMMEYICDGNRYVAGADGSRQPQNNQVRRRPWAACKA